MQSSHPLECQASGSNEADTYMHEQSSSSPCRSPAASSEAVPAQQQQHPGPDVTRLVGSDQPISQDVFVSVIKTPGAALRDVAQVFAFKRAVPCKVNSGTHLTHKQIDALCAVAGCSDVNYMASKVKPKVMTALKDCYGISKSCLSAWFRVTRAQVASGRRQPPPARTPAQPHWQRVSPKPQPETAAPPPLNLVRHSADSQPALPVASTSASFTRYSTGPNTPTSITLTSSSPAPNLLNPFRTFAIATASPSPCLWSDLTFNPQINITRSAADPSAPQHQPPAWEPSSTHTTHEAGLQGFSSMGSCQAASSQPLLSAPLGAWMVAQQAGTGFTGAPGFAVQGQQQDEWHLSADRSSRTHASFPPGAAAGMCDPAASSLLSPAGSEELLDLLMGFLEPSLPRA